jgi:GAF domain-containing protein
VLNDIAISDPGWVACTMGDPIGHRALPIGLKAHGIYGRVLRDGKGFFTNDPGSHADRIGLPEGHPPLEAFIGVPLTHEGKTIGMIGLGNRDGVYSQEHLEALEKIAPAITKSLVHRRSEEALHSSESKYRTLFNSIDEGFFLIDVMFDENDRPVDLYYVNDYEGLNCFLSFPPCFLFGKWARFLPQP